jgi:hypothetical protein
MAHRHHHLDHSGHTRGGLSMTNIRLDRSQPQRALAITTLPVGSQQRLCLDRIAQRRTGAMRLNCIDLGGRQTNTSQRLTNHALLRRTTRRRQTITRAILIHG